MTGATGKRKTELCSRQRDIAVLLGRGLRQVEIAAQLNLTQSAVGGAIKQAKDKLELYSTAQFAEYARKQGWCG